MDQTDLNILTIMKQNGRASVSDISKQVNLSIPAVSERIRKLEDSKVIEQYTILFWAGVFSTKMAEENMDKPGMYLFGLGAVLSTVFFLTVVSILGHSIHTFLSLEIIRWLNVLVGFLLIFFGIKTAVKV